MSAFQKAIFHLPLIVKEPLIKFLYFKNGHRLNSFQSFDNKYFIYEVDNHFVASETLGWFVTYEYYKDWVDNLSGWAYKPKAGDVVVDIGAGLGEETLVYSKLVGSSGSVFSIEANPEVFAVLKNIVSLNSLKNVHLFNNAVNNENGEVVFSVDQSSYIGGGIGAKGTHQKEFKVDGFRMDTFIETAHIQRIDLLKTNIEGAERFVISSLGDSVSKIRNVAISCHDFRYRYDGNEFFRTRNMVEEYLKDNHFSVIPDNNDRKFDDWVYAFNTISQ
jgi:FkbM family methyltransferase